jgi:ABC-2 type transport system permease protein
MPKQVPREYRTPNQARVALGLARYSLVASLRNRTALFFNFIFPLVLVFVFGTIGGGGPSKVNLGIPDGFDKSNQIYATLKAAADQGKAQVKFTTGSETELEKKVKQSKVDSILQAPPDGSKDSIKLVSSNGNPSGKAVENVIGGVVSQMNLGALQGANPTVKPPFSVSTSEISGKTFKTIDFALPGLIAFSLLSLATFGVAFPFITMRETLVLKRIFATTVRPLTLSLTKD